MSDIGHNSKDLEVKIQEFFVEYAECDEASAVLNKKRADIREKVEELGLDRKAFHDQYMRAKRKLREKEGYDESAQICFEALNKMDQGELFDFVDRMKEEREAAKEAKKKEREEAKAKDDEYKPAAERKPKGGKVVSGKDAAAGEKSDDDEPSVGEQQAAAYNAAHGTQTVN